MSIGNRIKMRRMQMGLSVDELAKQLGKNRATVYRYESDEIENLPLSILEPLSKALGVSPAYLMGWEGTAASLPARRVPLLGDVAAGEPILAYEDRRTYVAVDGDLRVDFCLRVKGDSMIDARIQEGDIVFVRRQSMVNNGELAVVLIDNEATLKRFYRSDSGVILKPENPKYQPRFYTEHDFKTVRVLGKAVMFQSQL